MGKTQNYIVGDIQESTQCELYQALCQSGIISRMHPTAFIYKITEMT